MKRATLPRSNHRSSHTLTPAKSVAGHPLPYQSGAVGHPSHRDVIGPMERPQPLIEPPVEREFGLPIRQREKPFQANFFVSLGRLLTWLWGITVFSSGVFFDRFIRRNDTEVTRAKRLYETFKWLGGTFVKIGQQLSIRNDLLPDVVCAELSKLQDKVDPFPYKEAIKIIEGTTRKPLEEIFSQFDPAPIGSGSVACVYQACLKENGQRVVVKVRRPNIGQMFAADFAVLRMLRQLFRFLDVIDLDLLKFSRTLTREFIDEVESTLLEELNFELEARHQSLFREYAQKSRWGFFTAPHVYFKFSGKDVIVQEFVSGLSMKDLLAIVENGNGAAHAARVKLRRYRINPKIVARRLLRVNYWGLWENFFFHADPHPSNIVVQPNNRLVFLDFGSTGLLGHERRLALQEVYDHTDKKDVEGAARVSLTLMEPLPPIDVHRIQKSIQVEFRYAIVAMESEGGHWSERTTAQLWLGFFNVTRAFGVPINPAVVRLIRGTMLYDTVAARLDNDIDIQAEYRKYKKTAGAAARQRLKHELKKRKKGPIEEDYLRLEQVIDEGNRLVFRTVRAINTIPFRFDSLGKALRVVQLTGELVFRLLTIWGVLFIWEFFSLLLDPKKPLDLSPLANPLGQLTLAHLRDLFLETFESFNQAPEYLLIGGGLTILLLIRTIPRITDYLGKRSGSEND